MILLLVGAVLGGCVGLVLGLGIAAARLPGPQQERRARAGHRPGVRMGSGQVLVQGAPRPQLRTSIPAPPPRTPACACTCRRAPGGHHVPVCPAWRNPS